MTVNIEKLARMAEQITLNMAYTDDEEVVAVRVADHLSRFWDPRMRAAITSYAANPDNDLSNTLKRAVARLAQ